MGSAADGDVGSDVVLNVYDLLSPENPDALPLLNSYLYPTGLGLYHSGVEVYNTEYAFGGHMYDYTGVFEVAPRTAPEARFRQAIRIGRTDLDELQVARLMARLAKEWPGNGYNLLTRNCNDFADELCRKLVGKGAPAWVNRLAWIGQNFKFLLPEGFDSPMAAPVVPELEDTDGRREEDPQNDSRQRNTDQR